MKVLTLLNEKGGVGRTTLATHIAAGLAIAGAKVVLADTDMQGNATTALGCELEPCMYDLMARKNFTIKDALRATNKERYAPYGDTSKVAGELFVIPSNEETRNIATSIGDDLERFQDKLSPLDGAIDFVIVDTSPTATLFHTAIYVATTDMLFPTRLEQWSLDGLLNVYKRRINANKVRMVHDLPPINTVGIVPTMAKMRTILHQDALEEIHEIYRDAHIFDPIVDRTAWAEAARFGVLMYNYDFDNVALQEFAPVLRSIMEAV